MTAQVEWPKLDVSPMDQATYPRSAAFGNYLEADDPDKSPKIKVAYSRPYKKDRTIFGELVKYDEDWRLGANEGTEVTFFQNVELNGTVIPRGRYRLYAEVKRDVWHIAVSKHTNTAGMSNIDKTMELGRFPAQVSSTNDSREQFTIGFQKVDDGNVNMLFEWDKVRATLPINLNASSLAGEDASPMDMIFYPAGSKYLNFSKPEELVANQPKIKVQYSRPQMKERKIFGELLKYGEMWRMGANETTLITFYQPVTIGGKKLRAGTYGIFATVNEKSWDVIIHSNTNSWGHANHDAESNVQTITVPVEKTKSTLDALSMTFDKKSDKEVHVLVGWENTMVRIPVMMD
jgi:hypothetical protein